MDQLDQLDQLDQVLGALEAAKISTTVGPRMQVMAKASSLSVTYLLCPLLLLPPRPRRVAKKEDLLPSSHSNRGNVLLSGWLDSGRWALCGGGRDHFRDRH